MTSAKIRILLADDDPDDRDLFTEAIDAQNADVDTVWNGAQLMKVLDSNESLPDFIFLDLNMPEKGGKECLQEIRQHSRLKEIPVIIYSTSSSKKDIDDTYELGANLYITKPNSFSELKKAVTKIITLDWSNYPPRARKSDYVFSAS